MECLENIVHSVRLVVHTRLFLVNFNMTQFCMAISVRKISELVCRMI